MANSINGKLSGILLSSNIRDVVVNVAGEYIDVKLTTDTQKVLLSERYYPVKNQVSVYDIRSIVESEMRNGKQVLQKFELSIHSDSSGIPDDYWQFTVIYCDRKTLCPNVDAFLAENFLTTFTTRRLPMGAALDLYFYAQKDESVAAQLNFICRSKESDRIYRDSFLKYSGETAAKSGIQYLSVTNAEVAEAAAACMECRPDEVVLLEFSLYVGHRFIECFIDYSLNPEDGFYFTNCFNCWDSIFVPNVSTEKTDVERSSAMVNGYSKFYNQSVTKSFEVEAGPLTAHEAQCMEQLLSSYSVCRQIPNNEDEGEKFDLMTILITESTCDIKYSDTALISAKFIWRFADNIPLMQLHYSKGIFTSPFNPAFN